jgi:CrcB protein
VEFLLVFMGSGIGGMARHGVGLVSLRWLGPAFPFGTLAVNVVGSALMGLVVGLLATAHVTSQETRLFLATGLLGGFTTFSAFSLDAVALWERGDHGLAIAYALASVVLSLTALAAVMVIVRRLA